MMNHEPYFRKGTGRNAVLLIHGIAGSPSHFRDLIPVIPETFTVCNILLEGHSGAVENISRSSMKKWKAQVMETLHNLLTQHDQVVIVAHSMGTLFAIQAAIDHPDSIPQLFLLAVPTRPRVRFTTMIDILKVNLGIRNSPGTQTLYQATALSLTPKLWRYIGWTPRMLELIAECNRVRKMLSNLTVPTQTFQSQVDEMVSKRSCRDLQNHPRIKNTVLYRSGHFLYGEEDLALLQSRLEETLKSL